MMHFIHTPNTPTKNERKILDFISQNPTQFLSLSITELARKLGMSDASLSRFAKSCGYKDYKELKLAVANQQEGFRPSEKINESLENEHGNGLFSFLQLQQQFILKTMEHIDSVAFERAVTEISAAKNIYIHAKGAACSLGDLLAFRLNRFGLHVTLLPSSGSEIFEKMASITKNDIVICFGFQRCPNEDQVLLTHCRKIGCPTVLFNSSLHASWTSLTDIPLFIYRGEEREYHSMAVPMAVMDALILRIYRKIQPSATLHLDAIHELKELYSQDIPR